VVSFRKSVESLIADERARKYNILADRLTVAINAENGTTIIIDFHGQKYP